MASGVATAMLARCAASTLVMLGAGGQAPDTSASMRLMAGWGLRWRPNSPDGLRLGPRSC